jgi:hypothetical protein
MVIHGISFEIRAETPHLATSLFSLFGGYFPIMDVPDLETSDFFSICSRTVDSVAALPTLDPEFDELWSCAPDGEQEVVCYKHGSRRALVLNAHAVLLYDLVARAAELTVLEDAWPAVSYYCLVPFLTDLFASEGKFLIHSAANRLPDGRAVLLLGQSGAGKTTTSLALGFAGLPVICDDAGFLFSAADRFEVLPLPRDSHVHTETIDLLPRLMACTALPSHVENEFSIAHRELPVCSPFESRPVGAVILLDARNAEEHRLMPITGLGALPDVLSRVLRVAEPLATGPAGNLFRLLSRLCAQTPCFRLSVGPDLLALPGLLRDGVCRDLMSDA